MNIALFIDDVGRRFEMLIWLIFRARISGTSGPCIYWWLVRLGETLKLNFCRVLSEIVWQKCVLWQWIVGLVHWLIRRIGQLIIHF